MPTVIRKSSATLLDTRREVLHAVSWQVRSHVWSPPTDEYENEETYVVLVEIAGMRDDDFEISLENNILLVSGTRPDFLERRAYQQMEIRFGKFETSVHLPGPVDIEQARAEYQDGFLTIILPKEISDRNKVE
ncbi:Hsp20/alpha crystallin family protein [Candidatus Villigracilis saccharophilus]|uniref:Hsp20/alpha crystallin family protein n=1 Tax=Candidatus Villigracilis saccharophilus TaxID=3140684 RepID=UPI003135B48A|nr:Hsp20/alpha crystallin family protein [Anaerolineales bacterium]